MNKHQSSQIVESECNRISESGSESRKQKRPTNEENEENFGLYVKLEAFPVTMNPNVADPDMVLTFEPPRSASRSISQRYRSGSGSFYHQAKKVRKTLIPTAL
jgi:hypothetical protein